MTGAHDEWRAWSADWRNAHAPQVVDEPALRRHVEAYRRRMILVIGVEVLITVAGLAGTALAVSTLSYPASAAWATASLLFIAIVWTFALWNRRGTWRPVADTTDAFVELSYLRYVRQLRSVRFVLVVVGATAAGLLAWISWRLAQRPVVIPATELVRRVAVPSLILVSYVVWAVWYRRRAQRHLAELAPLRESLLRERREVEREGVREVGSPS